MPARVRSQTILLDPNNSQFTAASVNPLGSHRQKSAIRITEEQLAALNASEVTFQQLLSDQQAERSSGSLIDSEEMKKQIPSKLRYGLTITALVIGLGGLVITSYLGHSLTVEAATTALTVTLLTTALVASVLIASSRLQKKSKLILIGLIAAVSAAIIYGLTFSPFDLPGKLIDGMKQFCHLKEGIYFASIVTTPLFVGGLVGTYMVSQYRKKPIT